MAKKKKAKINISGDNPLEIVDSEEEVLDLDELEQRTFEQLGKTFKAYIEASKELLSGRYAHLKGWTPIYMSDPGQILVSCCSDGIVVRFERKTDKSELLMAWFPGQLSEIAAVASQGVINCYTDRNYVSTIPTKGLELKIIKGNSITNIKEEIAVARIGFDVVIERPEQFPRPPRKPYCLLSIQNSLELHIEGILEKNDANPDSGQRFLTRSALRLPVGWDCIEIYPFFDLEQWKPEYAPIWAENDLLAIAVAHQFQEMQFQSLDPKAAAREHYAQLLKKFKELLDSNPDREETLQVFLRDNPALLSPTNTKMWPKLALGNRKTDFVFREANGEYILVELERSTYQLFNKDGHTSQDLNHAHGQILDWKRYLEDNLSTVQHELGLTGISTNPSSLIVIGRSQDLTPDNRRKLTTIENEIPKVKIMTYDDVYENAKSVVENLLGLLWEVPGNTRIYYLQNN